MLVGAPAAGLAAAFVAHLGFCRVRGGSRIVPTLLFGAVIGAVVMLGISWWSLRRLDQVAWTDAAGRLAINCIAFNAGFYLYTSLFIALSSSLRIAALRIIAAAAGPVSPAELAALTDRSHLAADRLRRLVADGRLTCRDGRYFCNPDWLLMVSRFYSLWRTVLFGVPYLADMAPGSPTPGPQLRSGRRP
jgi:hypothetical protein